MPLHRNPTAVAVVLLVVLGTALYATNLNNPFFWDDHDLVVMNPDVQGLGASNLRRMFTRDMMAAPAEVPPIAPRRFRSA